VIWLPRGCKFDETDGHVDDLACFVRPGEVVLQWTDNRDDPQWEIYQEAYDILRSTRDSRGRELIVHKLPQPDVLEWTAEEAEGLDQQDSTHPPGRHQNLRVLHQLLRRQQFDRGAAVR
jgi:agmatine deiminase